MIDTYSSPLGRMIMTSDGENLTGLYFAGQKHLPRALDLVQVQETFPRTNTRVFDATCKWLDEYFAGCKPRFLPPLSLNSLSVATEFRLSVWQVLLAIPYGETASYCEVAKTVANMQGKASMSSQAVGQAVGHNPISIIIPCHRVLGKDGSLTGYAGGVERKEWLLCMEKRRILPRSAP